MTTCTKCGKMNEEDARFCVSCGATLYPVKRNEKQEDDCFGRRGREQECFGLPYGGAIAGIVFGTIIVILGLGMISGLNISQYIGPMFVIIIGILIVAGAIYGLSRRPRSK